MIYTTGTIAVSGNTLTGTGTNFTAAGSLIRNGCTVIAMTSPVQVFQITAIGGATSLTVTPAANPAIPAGTKYAILLSDSLSVDGLAQDIAETFTMYQRYMSGFADVMNGTTDVTITINGVAVTVPGQKSLAKKGANSDITSLSGLTTALSIEQGGTGSTTASGARTNLGLGNSATRDVGTAAGTVAAGNDNRFNTIEGKSGGTLSSSLQLRSPSPATTPANGVETASPIIDAGWSSGVYQQVHVLFHASVVQGSGSRAVIAIQTSTGGSYTRYLFDQSGNATAPGSWVPTSDARLKTDIKRIDEPLMKMGRLRGCTWMRLDTGLPGIGFLAQEVADVFPDVVTRGQDVTLADGSVIEGVLSPDTYGVAAALHHEAILALINEVNELKRMLSVEMKGS